MPQDIPGFYYDEQTKKYYKETPESIRKRRKKESSPETQRQLPKQPLLLDILSKELGSKLNFTLSPTAMRFKRIKPPSTFHSYFVSPVIDFKIKNSIGIFATANGILSKVELSRNESAKSLEVIYTDQVVRWLHASNQDDLTIAAICMQNQIRVISVGDNSFDIILKLSKDLPIFSSCFDNERNCVFGGSKQIARLKYWQGGQTLMEKTQIDANTDILSVLAHRTDYNTIMSGGRNGNVYLVDLRQKRSSSMVKSSQKFLPVTCIEHNDFYNIYSGHLDGKIAQWDSRFAKTPFSTFHSPNSIKHFSFEVIDDQTILSATDQGLFNCYDLVSQATVFSHKWGILQDEEASRPLFAFENDCFWIMPESSSTISCWHDGME